MRVLLTIMVVFTALQFAGAASADPAQSDPVQALGLEDRARADRLFKMVRCPICVGHSVAESDAEVSKSIRHYIEAEITGGSTDQEILQKLVAAYGDDILFSPRLSADTFFLWGAPLFFTALGGVILWRFRVRASSQRRTS